MKERPIIFSTEMVRAILEGRKTQTRRVIKPQPDQGVYDARMIDVASPSGKAIAVFHTPTDKGFKASPRHCPYGQAGDRLWVRETWAARKSNDKKKPSWINPTEKVWYRTTSLGDKTVCSDQRADGAGKIRSPCFMPRWASRILLEITEVRVERLQDISPHELATTNLEREGLPWKNRFGIDFTTKLERYVLLEEFKKLWDSLNAHRKVDIWTNLKTVYPYSWEANPWVWVIMSERKAGEV